MSGPAITTFEPACDELDLNAVTWVKVPDGHLCGECRARGGWQPRVWQSDCPMCWGEDPYGEIAYCGECEFCCGC